MEPTSEHPLPTSDQYVKSIELRRKRAEERRKALETEETLLRKADDAIMNLRTHSLQEEKREMENLNLQFEQDQALIRKELEQRLEQLNRERQQQTHELRRRFQQQMQAEEAKLCEALETQLDNLSAEAENIPVALNTVSDSTTHSGGSEIPQGKETMIDPVVLDPTSQRKRVSAAECEPSSYRGVARNGNNWTAQITAGSKKLYLGYFPTAEDAARAYDKAAIEHHGTKARLNFAIS